MVAFVRGRYSFPDKFVTGSSIGAFQFESDHTLPASVDARAPLIPPHSGLTCLSVWGKCGGVGILLPTPSEISRNSLASYELLGKAQAIRLRPAYLIGMSVHDNSVPVDSLA